MTDRLQELSAQELERAVELLVERKFEIYRRSLPHKTAEVPVIGGKYDPHAPPEQHAGLIRDVVRALLAQKWAETELPQWMLPLPLSFDECTALFNGANQGKLRCSLRGRYGMHLRNLRWHCERATPFEVYCAGQLSG